MPPLPANAALRFRSRLHSLTAPTFRTADLLILAACGFAAAAATTLLDMNLRIPGHAILRTVLPLAVGLALVPRLGSGVVMSAVAGLSILGFRMAGFEEGGAGALTSLLLTGPLLDFAANRFSRSWMLYPSFAVAGLASNMTAYLVRFLTKAGGGARLGGGRSLAEWKVPASITYAVCGLIAGLIAAAVCFRATTRTTDHENQAP
jgi:hypothetical protein